MVVVVKGDGGSSGSGGSGGCSGGLVITVGGVLEVV